MLLCDTGVLLAAGNVKDQAHRACVRLLREADGPLLVPSPVMGEVGCLLQSRVGPRAEVIFLRSFGGDGFAVAELGDDDIRAWPNWWTLIWISSGHRRCAAVVAIAGRLRLAEVATIDHRHFSVVRPRHVPAFTLVPGSGAS